MRIFIILFSQHVNLLLKIYLINKNGTNSPPFQILKPRWSLMYPNIRHKMGGRLIEQ